MRKITPLTEADALVRPRLLLRQPHDLRHRYVAPTVRGAMCFSEDFEIQKATYAVTSSLARPA